MSLFSDLMPARLAHRIALTLTMLSLLMAMAIWLYGQWALIPSVEQSEQHAARVQATQTRDLYLESAALIERQTDRLANWDDTFIYASGADPQRLNSYLAAQKRATLGLDFIAIFDRQGELMTTAEWTGRNVERDDLALVRELSPATSFGRNLAQAMALRKTASGIVRLARGPYYLTISPIRPTDRQGPPAGYLVSGVAADKLLLLTKGPYSASQLSVLPITSRKLPDAVQKWVDQNAGTDQPLIIPDRDRIHTWSVVNSIDNQPALLLGSSEPRDTTRLATQHLRQLSLIAVLGTLLLGLVAWLCVHTLISKRLGWLLQSVHGLVRPGRVAAIEQRGNDEVAFLTRAINQLAGSKNTALESMRQAELQLDMIFSQAPGAMLQVRDGQVTDINEACTTLLQAPHAASLVGKHLADLLETSDATAKRLLLLTQSKQAGAQPLQFLCRLRCLDGSLVSCDIKALRLPVAGKPVMHLFFSPLPANAQPARPADKEVEAGGGRLISITDRIAPRLA